MLYLGGETLDDEDIPHRTSVSKMLEARYNEALEKIGYEARVRSAPRIARICS